MLFFSIFVLISFLSAVYNLLYFICDFDFSIFQIVLSFEVFLNRFNPLMQNHYFFLRNRMHNVFVLILYIYILLNTFVNKKFLPFVILVFFFLLVLSVCCGNPVLNQFVLSENVFHLSNIYLLGHLFVFDQFLLLQVLKELSHFLKRSQFQIYWLFRLNARNNYLVPKF